MFNLISAIIGIALVAVLAVSTLYFGGDVFESRQVKSDANTYITQAQQISSAMDYYRVDGNGKPSSIEELTPEYLRSIPEPPFDEEWSLDEAGLVLPVTSYDICMEVNRTVGLPDELMDGDIPTCTEIEDAGLSTTYFCCDSSGN